MIRSLSAGLTPADGVPAGHCDVVAVWYGAPRHPQRPGGHALAPL